MLNCDNRFLSTIILIDEKLENMCPKLTWTRPEVHKYKQQNCIAYAAPVAIYR